MQYPTLNRLAANAPKKFYDPNFTAQTNFLEDEAPLVAGFCTRRAGKSYGVGLKLLATCYDNPGVNCIYISLTRDSAKRIMWKDVLKIINRRMGLGIKFNETSLTASFPNGSILYLVGMDSDEKEKEKALGQKFKLAVIDEAGSFTTNLRSLVYGILKPALSDLRGQLLMIGTPSNFIKGLFYEVTQGVEPGWSLHKWTAFDNPYQVDAWKQEILEIERDRPLFKETPLFQQHYLGLWVIETDKLVYKFNQDRNIYEKRPDNVKPDGWSYVLGVDLGYEDDSAFVLCAFHENHPILYCMNSFSKKHMDITDVATKIKEYLAQYQIGKIIIDGADKQSVEEMRRRHTLPLEPAEKQGKADFIELMNADLIQGNIKVHYKNTDLIAEMGGLIWKTTGDIIDIPRKEHPSLPNHRCDAFLYAWRYCYNYMFEPIVKKAVVGTKQWHDEQNEKIWELEKEKLTQEDTDWKFSDNF